MHDKIQGHVQSPDFYKKWSIYLVVSILIPSTYMSKTALRNYVFEKEKKINFFVPKFVYDKSMREIIVTTIERCQFSPIHDGFQWRFICLSWEERLGTDVIAILMRVLWSDGTEGQNQCWKPQEFEEAKAWQLDLLLQ